MSDNPAQDSSIRLNKHLALQLGIARREADNLISSGQVSINGKTARLGSRVGEGDILLVDNRPVKTEAEMIYLALNKPIGYVCSRRRQGESPTIYELISDNLHHLKPVGRLDRDSSGLLLLTNDGDFTYRMTHPKFKKIKIYKVRLDRDLEPLHQQMIADFGVQLEDGFSKLGLERLSDDSRADWQITMSEGRNRQIRRTFSALGYTVVKLHRTHFGTYSLDDIKPGKTKLINIH